MATEKEKARDKEFQLFLKAKEKYSHMLFTKANVNGVDVGYRTRGGETLDEMVIKVYVTQKIPKESLAEDDLVPAFLNIDKKRISFDVEEVRVPEAQLFTLRTRPLMGGSSIGPLGPGAGAAGTGTLGTCVIIQGHHGPFILGTDHVLSRVGGIQLGALITQPSLADGGVAADDIVAVLTHRIPIAFGLQGNNRVDAALAVVKAEGLGANFNRSTREIHWIGYPAHTVRDLEGAPSWLPEIVHVHKMGRTTEYTTGTITSTTFDTLVDYSRLFGNPPHTDLARFVNQIRIEGTDGPFSASGDSGSLVLEAGTNRPVGLLFAGREAHSVANHIQRVRNALSIVHI